MTSKYRPIEISRKEVRAFVLLFLLTPAATFFAGRYLGSVASRENTQVLVEAGSGFTEEQAKALAGGIREAGSEFIFLSPQKSGGFRVLIGGFPNAASAKSAAERLRQQGTIEKYRLRALRK